MSAKLSKAISDLRASMRKSDPNFDANFAKAKAHVDDLHAKIRADRELAKVRATPAYKAAETKANAALGAALNKVPDIRKKFGAVHGLPPLVAKEALMTPGERISASIAEIKRTLSAAIDTGETREERVSKLLGKAIERAR